MFLSEVIKAGPSSASRGASPNIPSVASAKSLLIAKKSTYLAQYSPSLIHTVSVTISPENVDVRNLIDYSS